MLRFEFTGTVLEWRGPSPYYFVATPAEVTAEIEAIKQAVTYGWGVVPASVTIGGVRVTTSLIPRDGGFLVPLKDAVRNPNKLGTGDEVSLVLEI